MPDHLTRREILAASTGGGLSVAVSAAPGGSADPLRVALIGLQGHTNEVLAHIPRVAGCRLVAFAPSLPGESAEPLRKLPCWTDETRVYEGDFRRMLDEVRPDVVAVFRPYGLNGEANTEALRRGCHVISEKPIAGTLQELETLRREYERGRARLTTLLVMRADPALAAARKAVADGLIGEPALVSAQKSYRWGRDRPAFYKERRSYGGSIPWVAIHAIDFMRYVSGVEFADVTARHAVRVHRDYPECEDCGALLFTLANGGQASLTFDFLRPERASSHGDDRLRVVGSKGVVEVRITNESQCELITNDAPARRLPGEPPVSLFAQFVAYIRGGPAPRVTADDAFRATEVALKARDAADTRQTVALAR